jgi:hypothetical protein
MNLNLGYSDRDGNGMMFALNLAGMESQSLFYGKELVKMDFNTIEK